MTNERKYNCILRMINHHTQEADLAGRYGSAVFSNYLKVLNDRKERRKLFIAWLDFRRLVWEHLDAALYWENKLRTLN